MDVATVIAMLAVHMLCSGGLLFLISRRMPPRSGLGTWAAATTLFGAAYVGRIAGDLRDPAPASFPADVAMVAAQLLFDRGLRQFFGRLPAPLPLLPLIAGYAALHAAVVYGLGAQARFVELNLMIGAIYFVLVYRCLDERRQLDRAEALRHPLAGLAAIMLLVGALSLARAATIAQHGIGTLFQGWYAQVVFGIASIAAVLVALILLWMVFLRLNRQLAELATRDALTRVLNRNGLDDALARHFGARSAQSLTLLLVDIDHFKSINDGHGHPTGDAVLRAVAAELAAQVRGNDFVARTGGEEFIVGCVGIGDDAEALALAERLRAAIAGAEVRSADGGASVRCTASVGVSRPFGTRAEWERAVREADRALYAAKAAGRDRIARYDGDDEPPAAALAVGLR